MLCAVFEKKLYLQLLRIAFLWLHHIDVAGVPMNKTTANSTGFKGPPFAVAIQRILVAL